MGVVYLVVSVRNIVEFLPEFIHGLKGCRSGFVEIMGSAPGNKEIGGKLGGAIWWNDFGEGFACGNKRVRKRRSCRFGLNE